jgi:hypothetical protein
VGGALTPKMSYIAAMGRVDYDTPFHDSYRGLSSLANYVITHNLAKPAKGLLAPVYLFRTTLANTAGGTAAGMVYGALDSWRENHYLDASKILQGMKNGALFGFATGFLAGGFSTGKEYWSMRLGGWDASYLNQEIYTLYDAYLDLRENGVSNWHISNPNMYQATRILRNESYAKYEDLPAIHRKTIDWSRQWAENADYHPVMENEIFTFAWNGTRLNQQEQ